MKREEGLTDQNRACRMQFQRTEGYIASAMSLLFDSPPVRVQRRYAICSSPRSGSSLLAGGLAKTRQAGFPLEYFNPSYIKAYIHRSKCVGVTLHRYVRFLESRRSSANGVFGVKVHFAHVSSHPECEKLLNYIGNVDRLIILRRADRIAQAVSYWRAVATNFWNAGKPEDVERGRSIAIRYDGATIAQLLAELVEQEEGWERMLARRRTKCLEIMYEDLATNYVREMKRVLSYLGLSHIPDALFSSPTRLRIADHWNEECAERFMRDIRETDSFQSLAEYAAVADHPTLRQSRLRIAGDDAKPLFSADHR